MAGSVALVLRSLAGWWDGVELWLTQLTFPVQVFIVVAVVGPLCWCVAALIDTLVERSVAARLAALGQRRQTHPAAVAPPSGPAPSAPADER